MKFFGEHLASIFHDEDEVVVQEYVECAPVSRSYSIVGSLPLSGDNHVILWLGVCDFVGCLISCRLYPRPTALLGRYAPALLLEDGDLALQELNRRATPPFHKFF